MNDLKQRALRGGVAKICSQGAGFAIRIGALIVLARLLDPKDFGLVGMVTAVTGVFSLFKDAGLSMATVQRATITNEQVSNLFWINMGLGVIIGLLSLAAAPFLAFFYHEPRLFWVTAALGAGFLFNAAGVQHSALLQRHMKFSSLAAIEITSLLVSNAVGVGMALSGYGFWSLVTVAVLSPAVSTLCYWVTAKWVPGLPHRGVGISSMLRFGGIATLNGLVVYIAYNLEKVLLGRFWGAEALGIYGRAYQLVNVPTESLNAASGEIGFAALSRLQHEPDRLKNYFLKGYALVLSLTLPIVIASALFADDIILIILGPKWQEAIPLFRLLTPTILIFALINPLWWLLYSLGLAERSLKIALALAPLVITSYLLGLPYGPKGVAVAYSTVMTLCAAPLIMWGIHGTVVTWRDLVQVVSRPFLSALVAAVVVFVVQFLVGQSLLPTMRLLLGSGIVLIVYLWMLLHVLGQKALYVDLLQSMKRRAAEDEKQPPITLADSSAG